MQPTVKIIEPNELDAVKSAEISNSRDTALIWLPELAFDSIKVVVQDAGRPLDTITLRRSKKDTYNRAVLVSDNIPGTKIRPKSDFFLKLTAPVATAQPSQIKLLEDSVEVKFQLQKQAGTNRVYSLKYPWKLNKEYNLRVNENAFTDTYGNKSKLYIKKFTLDTEDNYGNISIKVTVPDTSQNYIVQWMSDKETIYRQDVINKNTTLNYLTYPTAKYRVRIIFDKNKNGIWDTGNVFTRQQPEETWTFDQIISLRPNWDLEETIIIPKLTPD